MKWTVTLIAEPEPGQRTEHPLTQIERGDAITPASLGLSIAEGKAIVAAIQTAIVAWQSIPSMSDFWQSIRGMSGCGSTNWLL